MIWEAVRLALRSILRNKLRSFLTILGVVIGVAAVIAMVTVGQGSQQQVAACAPVPKAPEPQKLTLDADGLFRFDRSELEDLLPASRAKIDAFITQVKTWKTVASIAITGHTDRLGSDAYNQRLSAARAETVKNYLVSQGASSNVIQAKSVGKSQPLTTAEQCPSSLKPAALIACLQPDRRIEIAIQGSKD